MSFLAPNNDFSKDSKKDPKKISSARLGLWLIALGIGVYMVVNGLFGVITGHPLF